MARTVASIPPAPLPAVRDIVELLKPVTWFPPMWAFMCGVVSSGAALLDNWQVLLAGIVLAGPLVCGTSQAVNDWYDRHVDAINEPKRPIPSGRVGGTWGLRIALIGSMISLGVGALIGPWVLAATFVALLMAWGYSAPPFRFKTNGWLGPLTVGLSYEGLSWFTGASAMASALPSGSVLLVLGLYSLGAHGIMVLNDFKAVEGDRATGLRSLPVTLGVRKAAWVACVTMAVPQFNVIALLASWDMTISALAVGVLTAAQIACMPRMIGDPAAQAPWYNATGVMLYVLGMLAAALGLGGYL